MSELEQVAQQLYDALEESLALLETFGVAYMPGDTAMAAYKDFKKYSMLLLRDE